MPFPIAHLIAAHAVADHFPIANRSDFYLGTIATDAISSTGIWSRDEKRSLHFTMPGDTLQQRTVRTNQLLAENTLGNLDFALGYRVHLHLDNLWSHLVARYFLKVIPAVNPESDLKRIYYEDMSIIDGLLQAKCRGHLAYCE